MTQDLWITECGIMQETELSKKATEIHNASGNVEECYVMALYADRFACARSDKLGDLLKDVERLLELRVFDDKRELWAHRSMLGQPFAWRIAEDGAIGKNLKDSDLPDFFKNPKNYMLETCQLLDIDDDEKHAPTEQPKYGGRLLRSTGRGVYELPIDREDAVRLVSYIRYDDNGVANVVDYRLKGFCELGNADNAKGGEKQ